MWHILAKDVRRVWKLLPSTRVRLIVVVITAFIVSRLGHDLWFYVLVLAWVGYAWHRHRLAQHLAHHENQESKNTEK